MINFYSVLILIIFFLFLNRGPGFISRHFQFKQLNEQMSRQEEQIKKQSSFQKAKKQEQSFQTEPEIKEIDYKQIQVQEAYLMSRKVMMAQAEENAQDLCEDFFLYEKICEFSNMRKKYCSQILKYLLFGYLQMVEETKFKKLLKEQYRISKKTSQFIKQYPNIQKAREILIIKVKEIEEKMFQFHNTAGDEEIQSRKYQFQIAHILRNLSDPFNQIFRELIVNGSYSSTMITSMDQIDMLQPSKRQYVFTKKSSLLNNQEKILNRSYRYSKLQSQEIKKMKKQRKDKRQKVAKSYEFVQIKKEDMNLQFLLSNKFIQKLEIQLMEIPNKSIRKAALTNLKNIFST